MLGIGRHGGKMSIQLAEQVWQAAAAYAVVGLLFALVYLIFALRRVDPGAAESPLRVKFLILPGVVALWPLLLLQWLASPRGASDA